MNENALILDASVTLAWVAHRQSSSDTDRVRKALEAGMQAVTTPSWRSALMQVLVDAEAGGTIERTYTNRIFTLLDELPIEILHDYSSSHFGNWLRIARETRLDIERSSYIELALRKSLPIATIDNDTISAAELMGVKLF